MTLPSTASLEEFNGLIPWLVDGSWREHCESVGEPDPSDTLRINAIRVLVDEAAASGNGIRIEADYSKNPEHLQSTDIFLKYGYDRATRSQKIRMESACRCSGDSGCRHAAAILGLLTRIAGGEEAPEPPAPKPIQRRDLSFKTRQWLAEIKAASALQPASDPIPATDQKPTAPFFGRFLAYCIESHHDVYRMGHESLHLALRVGVSKNSGITIAAAEAAANPYQPAQYLAPEDIPICASFHARSHNHGLSGSVVRLADGGWENILPASLATGRMVFGTPSADRKGSADYQIVTAGEPMTVETAWELDVQGRARPVLKLPAATMVPILTHPPRYLDTATCRIGLLRSDLHPRMLTTWSEGPTIPADETEALSREIVRITPRTPLAIPSDSPVRNVVGHDPVPHLEITEILIGPFLKRHLGGIVSFRYADLPPVAALTGDAPTTTVWLDNGERVLLDRDPQAETTRYQELRDHRLIPAAELLPSHDLNDKTRHSVILEKLQATASEWMDFTEGPDIPALRKIGWIVDIHPKAGLTVHDAGDFFPSLVRSTTLDVDWFRFDVTAEFDGKRVSLIPQIARAIKEDLHLRYPDPDSIPDTLLLACDKPSDGHIRFPARRFLEMLAQVRHLFQGLTDKHGVIQVDRLGAARLADTLEIDDSETTAALAALGRNLRDIHGLPATPLPKSVQATLRPYQLDGFRWLRFLATHGLHGILADDMGLGKTLQTLSHLAAAHETLPNKPSLVVAPTSVIPNWAAEATKFTPHLKTLLLHGSDRGDNFSQIPQVDVVFTSYPLLARDIDILTTHDWQCVVLDEAHYIKNPKALVSKSACRLRADHRLCLSGTPMENHLGELWSLMRFLMPGHLGDEKSFNTRFRKPIERDKLPGVQLALNRRISPLILRRTKDQVATDLPEKTTLIHRIDLAAAQTDLYESIRAAMDERVRHAIAEKGIAKSHIIALDALLKLRQICCHPQLLGTEAARNVTDSAKFEYLTAELLPTLIEEGRRILLFSQFTSMLDHISKHLRKKKIPYLELTGKTKDRASLVRDFQSGSVPIFLISLKAGGTGLNLTAADTIIHYDPWWNPAAENQATDRAHRIGQTQPVFVHKLVCAGTIEERILELQTRKSKLVKALLSEETTALKIDSETLSHLLAPP